MRCVLLLSLAIISLLPAVSTAAELTVLTTGNWNRLAVLGKEADCILGDFVLRSDRLSVVVAQPLPTRHANMTVRQVAGAVIDFTAANLQNDQLSAYYPARRRFAFTRAKIQKEEGRSVILDIQADASDAKKVPQSSRLPAVLLQYELEDGKPYLLIRTAFSNPFDHPLTVPLEDDLRMDNVETRVKAGPTDLYWVHDRYFDQAYGIVVDDHSMQTRSNIRESVLQYFPANSDEAAITLQPGQSYTLVRRRFPASNLLQLKGTIAQFRKQPVVPVNWRIADPDGQPVTNAELTIREGDQIYGTARTNEQGITQAVMPAKQFELTAKADGRPTVTVAIDLTKKNAGTHVDLNIQMQKASTVAAEITDSKGNPIPCKVAFKGIEGTSSPNWGPPAAQRAVDNLYYSENGKFTVPINPGTYEAIISYGPEHDIVRQTIEVVAGQSTPLKATLRRAFAMPGWVSADFHSHSSPSGDNTADQRGRVLNLLCEQIDFAPCTEHNLIDTYVAHLKALGATRLMGTCTGIELTGSPLPLNHHNAFPLEHKPRTRDGGGPVTDADPTVQIRRLAEWGDPKAERLVQQNHPDIGWLFFDKNGDGQPDDGHKAGFQYMHVIEVHPIHEVLNMKSTISAVENDKRTNRNNTVFNWLQLLNQGYRIPGVVNTDAHYNFHGSGGLRIFVRCDTEIPGDIDPLDIVREAKKGHIIMSNGPFMQVQLNDAIPGDDLKLPGGKGKLGVYVYCPNWFDIDRVQVLVNGRPDSALNFTRESHPNLFSKEALRFAHNIDLHVDRDAHIIVVAVGEKSELGEVMGPMWGRQNPVAISNPIYVDVDGNGFQHNGDTLGAPLPVRSGMGRKE